MATHTDTGNCPSRSEVTRQRLLDAALRLFGREGFDAVSTRSLAAAANVNQAAIPYHFDSKEGLYCAVARTIVDNMQASSMGALTQTIRARHVDGVTDLQQARADIVALVLALLQKIVQGSNRYEVGCFIMREQMQPTAAMDVLYADMLEPLHELLGELVAALRDKPETDPEVIIEVQVLYGQAVVFGAHRTTLSRRLGPTGTQKQRLEHVKSVVHDMIMRQFPLPDDEQGPFGNNPVIR